MLHLNIVRQSHALAIVCLAALLSLSACSTHVEYDRSELEPLPDSTSTKPCLSPSPPAECNITCPMTVQNGSPCTVAGQNCRRPDGDCEFHAVCDGLSWVGSFNCSGGPPPPPPPDCMRCVDFLTTPMPGGVLCPESEKVFFELTACACQRGAMDPVPGCKDVCSDNFCSLGADKASMECISCVQMQFCQEPLQACINGF